MSTRKGGSRWTFFLIASLFIGCTLFGEDLVVSPLTAQVKIQDLPRKSPSSADIFPFVQTSDLTTWASTLSDMLSSTTPSTRTVSCTAPLLCSNTTSFSLASNATLSSSEYTSTFIWSQTPGGTLSAATPATVTLSPVPLGVNGSALNLWVRISGGTGTAETVQVTGGTAVSGATSGTLIFTPANAHSGSWVLGTATAGIQETHDYLPATGGFIYLSAGDSLLYAPVTIDKDGVTLAGAGHGWSNNPSPTIGTRLTVVNGANLPYIIKVTSSGFSAYGFELYGNRANQSSGTGTGIWLFNGNAGETQNFTRLANLGVIETRGIGIRGSQSGAAIYDVVTLTDVSVRDTGAEGVTIESLPDWTLINCNVGGNTGPNLSLAGTIRAKVIGGIYDFSSTHGVLAFNTAETMLVGLSVEQANQNGVLFFGTNVRSTIDSITSRNNSRSGAGVSDGIAFSGVYSDIIINSSHSFDNQTTKFQRYGISFSGTGSSVILTNNDLSGNLTGPQSGIPSDLQSIGNLPSTLGSSISSALSVSGNFTAANFSGSSSGTNTGDQTITLTGDVTGTGTGSFPATIANDSVTLAKQANISTATFLGRNTAGTGDPEVLSVATAKTMLNLAGTNSGDQVIPVNTTSTTSQWFSAYNSSTGVFTKSQPAFSDISSSLACSQTPAFTGDFSTSAGSCSSTLSSGFKGWTDGGSTVTTTTAGDLVGIGGTPIVKAHVIGTSAGVVADPGSVFFMVENSGTTRADIIAGASSDACMYLGRQSSALAAGMCYQNSNDQLYLRSNGVNSLFVSGSNMGVNGFSSWGTSSVGVIGIANGTCPTTSPANAVQLCVRAPAASDANLFSRNEAGALEQLTGLHKRNSTQFDATSNTTLANVTGLTFNLEAGKVYGFTAELPTTANVAGGVKFAVSGTATATSIWYKGELDNAGTITITRSSALGTAVCAMTAATAADCSIKGVIVVNAAGTFTVQFAQNASNGSASSVLANGRFYLEPIGN